jgi:amidase
MNDRSVVDVPKGDVKHTLSAAHQPVVTVDPGTRLRIETELNIGDVLHEPGDVFEPEMVRFPYLNGATGPIEVVGATPEHVLVCDVEEIELIPPGFTALMPRAGPFVDWIRHRGFGVHARVVDIADGHVLWDENLRLPVKPMVGVIGTAPLLEAISTIDCGRHGGNLDAQEITPGTRVYLPIAVDGARFFLGDCHAIQGDGELCGLGGIEVRTRTTVRLDLIPRMADMRWLRFETGSHIGSIACARPLEDAFRLAIEELITWMTVEYGFAAPDALLLLGQVAEARCSQLANPHYTYVAKIAKRFVEPYAASRLNAR